MGNGVGGSVTYKNAEKGIHNRILDDQITTIPCQYTIQPHLPVSRWAVAYSPLELVKGLVTPDLEFQ